MNLIPVNKKATMKIACRNYVSPGRILAIGGAIVLLSLTKTVIAVAILIFALLELLVFVRKKAIAIKAQELRKKQKSDIEEVCDKLNTMNEKLYNSWRENISDPLQKVEELATAKKDLIDRHLKLEKLVKKVDQGKIDNTQAEGTEEWKSLGNELLDLGKKIQLQDQEVDEYLSQINEKRLMYANDPTPRYTPPKSDGEYKEFKVHIDNYSERVEKETDEIVLASKLAGEKTTEYAKNLELYNVKLHAYQLKVCDVAQIKVETLLSHDSQWN